MVESPPAPERRDVPAQRTDGSPAWVSAVLRMGCFALAVVVVIWALPIVGMTLWAIQEARDDEWRRPQPTKSRPAAPAPAPVCHDLAPEVLARIEAGLTVPDIWLRGARRGLDSGPEGPVRRHGCARGLLPGRPQHRRLAPRRRGSQRRKSRPRRSDLRRQHLGHASEQLSDPHRPERLPGANALHGRRSERRLALGARGRPRQTRPDRRRRHEGRSRGAGDG